MTLKAFYHRMEDRYFNFLDRMEKKGINFYKIVDPLEKRGIPTFAIFWLIILAVLVLLGIVIAGQFTAPSSSNDLVFTFMDPSENLISNQSLDINLSGTIKSIATDSYGVTKVKGMQNGLYSLSLIGSKYLIDTPSDITVTTSNKSFTIYLSEKVAAYSKTIYFKSKATGEQILTSIAIESVTCTNNSNFIKESFTVVDGSYTLNNIPSDCGQLEVTFVNNNSTQENDLTINNLNRTGEIFLEGVGDNLRGDVTISILDEELNIPVSGVVVSLYNGSGFLAGEATTSTNGIVNLSSIELGTYSVGVRDPDAIYSGIIPADGVKIDVALEGINIIPAIKIKKDIVGTIKLKIVDLETNQAIENVDVSLFKGDTKLSSFKTNADGLVNFGIREDIGYTITFDNADYTVKTQAGIRKNDAVQTIKLKRISQETFRGVMISVVDKDVQPVEYASVRIWDMESNTVVKEGTADVFGKIIIPNLDPQKTYKVDAVSGKYVSSPSSPFMIVERELTEIQVRMDIGEVTYNITITDGVEPISTQIAVYDVYNNREIENKRTTTSVDGSTIIRVRADKIVYFVINNYDSKFITGKYSQEANNTLKLNFTLPKVSNSSNIEYLGLYDSSGNQVTSVSPGQSVKARFVLNVNNNYSKVVAHIRTGAGNKCDGVTHLLEEDDVYIKEINAGTNKISGSVSYTPCLGEGTDLASKTTRDAKWFNVTVDSPMTGSYLIEATLVISDLVTTAVPVYYRAEYYSGGNILRYPQDDVLGQSSTSGTKQGLYAYTKEAQIFTGQSNFCDSTVCYNFYMYNESTKITKNIIDKYSPKSNTAHKLYFNLNFLRPVSGATLNLTSNGSTILLKDYSIEGVGSRLITGKEFDSIELGTIGANDYISGVVSFAITNDNSDVLNFNLLSASETVFSKSIIMDIKPSNNINFEMSPRAIAPFVPNDVIMVLTDDNNKVIQKADVTVKINKLVVVTGQTNLNGVFGFVLPAPDLGDVIEIIIRKEGYKNINTTMTVSSDMISTIPEKVAVYLDLSAEYTNTTNITLINNTTLPLAITAVKYDTDNKYVKLQLSGDDKILAGGSSVEYALKTSVTDEGVNLMTAKTFSTDLIITLENIETKREWKTKIPVDVRIGFGNSLDTLDCLQLTPASLELRGEGNVSTESSFKIKNTCTVALEKANLGNIFAEIDYGTSKEIGAVSLQIGTKNYILEPNNKTLILNTMAAGKEEVVKVIFKTGKLSTGLSEPIIYFTSKRANVNGVDEIESELDLSLIVNKYSECIDLPQTPVSVLACPYNYGSMGMGSMGMGNNMSNNYYGTNGLDQTRWNSQSTYNNNFGNSYAGGYNVNRYFNAGNNYNYGNGYYTQGYNAMAQQNPYAYGSNTGYVGSNMSTTNTLNYPNSYYNNGMDPNATQAYNMLDGGNGYGNMMQGNMMGCQSRPIYATNNCSEDVDLKFDAPYGINIISEKEMTLAKGEKKQVLISGAEEMGTFPLSVSARPNTDIDSEYKLIKEIPIEVSLPLSYLPSKCIVVTPQKLDFSGLKNGYQNVDVYNMCYSQGYRLVAVNYQDLNEIMFENIYFLSITGNSASLQPIRVDQVKDTKGNVIERWTVSLRRNPEVERIMINKYTEKYGTDASGIVSTIRTFGFDLGEQVALKFMLSVGLQPSSLNMQPIFSNVGMQLTDNMQWLGLFNKENQGLFGTQDANIAKDRWLSLYVNQEDRDALSYKLTPLYPKDYDIIFIKVKESALTTDKFRTLDKDDYSSVCFIGLIKDLPIENKALTSFIPKEQVQEFQNNGGRLTVQLSFEEEGYFKLCFKRPLDELKPDEVNVYDKFKELFSLMAYTEDGKKTYLQRQIYIGVDAKVGAGKLEGGKSLADQNTSAGTTPGGTTGGDTTTLTTCAGPLGNTADLGFTGENAFNKYGFNRLLLDWTAVTYKTCDMGNYYCDQEQLYKSIAAKQKKIDNSDYIQFAKTKTDKVDDRKFAKDSTGAPERLAQIWSAQNYKMDTTSESNQLKQKTELIDYINTSYNVLLRVPEELTGLTIISVENKSVNIDKSDFTNFVDYLIYSPDYPGYSNDGKYYFDAKWYIFIYKNRDDTLAQMKSYFKCADSPYLCTNDAIDDSIFNQYLQEFYVNMDVYYGVGLDGFIVNLEQFGNLDDSINKALMQTSGFLKSEYDMNLSSSTTLRNITAPGAYYIKTSLASKIISLNIVKEVKELNEFTDTTDRMYSKNPIFYKPINPNYYDYGKTGVPFLENNYVYKDYYLSWNTLQEGYTFKYFSTSAIPMFISSVPIKVNSSGTPTIQLIRDNTERTNFTKTWTNSTMLFVVNEDKTDNQSYQLRLKSDKPLTFNQNITSTSTNQYDVPKKLDNSTMNYKTIKALVDEIKSGNVCFTTTQQEFKTWNMIKDYVFTKGS